MEKGRCEGDLCTFWSGAEVGYLRRARPLPGLLTRYPQRPSSITAVRIISTPSRFRKSQPSVPICFSHRYKTNSRLAMDPLYSRMIRPTPTGGQMCIFQFCRVSSQFYRPKIQQIGNIAAAHHLNVRVGIGFHLAVTEHKRAEG